MIGLYHTPVVVLGGAAWTQSYHNAQSRESLDAAQLISRVLGRTFTALNIVGSGRRSSIFELEVMMIHMIHHALQQQRYEDRLKDRLTHELSGLPTGAPCVPTENVIGPEKVARGPLPNEMRIRHDRLIIAFDILWVLDLNGLPCSEAQFKKVYDCLERMIIRARWFEKGFGAALPWANEGSALVWDWLGHIFGASSQGFQDSLELVWT